ncbi:hypothetical protein DXZ75_09875 [Streptomyces sp. AcE210]|nr:hypothetical protein DXZ75_09875 [Streptomyces sp. AcE210]
MLPSAPGRGRPTCCCRPFGVGEDINTTPRPVVLLQRLRSRSISVPSDLAIVSYDDEFAGIADVALSAVAPPSTTSGCRPWNYSGSGWPNPHDHGGAPSSFPNCTGASPATSEGTADARQSTHPPLDNAAVQARRDSGGLGATARTDAVLQPLTRVASAPCRR